LKENHIAIILSLARYHSDSVTPESYYLIPGYQNNSIYYLAY